MSGHSKWATIKRKKAANDTQRSKLWAKLLRFVEVAAREGGGDPASNPTLATAVEKAKGASVPNDNIQRAIKRGTGELEGESYEEVTYEGYAPGGVAVLVHCLTSNRNRAAQDIRSVFNKQGGKMAQPGSVAFMFEARGVVMVPAAEASEEDVFLIAADAGAEDVTSEGEYIQVTTPPEALRTVREALAGAGIQVESAEFTQQPKSTVPVADSDAKRVLHLIEMLEELDDVQEVFGNFDISDEVLADVAS